MRALVVGSGAREHAIAHALRRSPSMGDLFAAPGNPGIGDVADLLDVPADDIQSLADAASDLKVDLTVVGPEVPLALGIADEFAARNLRLFGPTRDAAEIEASKVFAKQFCRRHHIPTAGAEIVSDVDDARAAVERFGLPVVLKADGLAAGKGVFPVSDTDQLETAIDQLFIKRRFGGAAERVLVEEFLEGDELSYMVICDGARVVPLATSHDYKRLGDGNTGPNTGGMGAHSPAVLPPGLGRAILEGIVLPAINGLSEEGRPYRGVLYVGLMLTDEGPKVLEFNCRLGDPETQPILLRLDEDFAMLLSAAADGSLSRRPLTWRREAAACVVLASRGYPGSSHKGDEIEGVEAALRVPGVFVYHAGTALEENRLLTAGGRVLSVCARRPTLGDAVATAYRGVDQISFDGVQYRRDIGRDSLEQLEEV